MLIMVSILEQAYANFPIMLPRAQRVVTLCNKYLFAAGV